MGISGKTRLVGLIGWPVSHSFSPVMHNAAAAALNLDWTYVPLPVHPHDLETAVRGLPALGFHGVNVTVPHKQAVMPLMDEIEPAAQAIGAVNTIVVGPAPAGEERDGRRSWLAGYNTDWSGLLADLTALNVEIAGRDCLILGAGGSARAVAYALAWAGGRVQVLARRVEQARQLVADLAPCFEEASWHYGPLSQLSAAVAGCAAPLVVNATPLGMSPNVDRSVWPDDVAFPRNAFVYDLVYNPTETKLMKQAQAAACHTANGLGLLVHQGALSFELWTGHKSDTAVMAAAIGHAV
jgi:shikimate dehydrogenase